MFMGWAFPGDCVQLPATFGKYELLERIATGGMAEVYLARSFGVAGFEKRLVIKRIRPELARDPHHVSLFINEAKIGVYLNHENVVQVYDLGRVGRDWFIAMEHLQGRDLNKLVKALRAEDRRLPVHVAVHVVAEVCRGLAYAHGLTDAEGQPLGLVHRDVSPHNILLTYSGGVKLVDFGIARLVGTGSVPAVPGTEDEVEQAAGDDASDAPPRRPAGGKYAYMSPEQARGEPVDHRTDVFSAGIVLWELLVGHRLFQHADPAEKLRLVQDAIVPAPEDEGIELDDALHGILFKALAGPRDERYASAALFEEDLRAWLYENAGADTRTELVQLLHEAFPRESSERTRAPGLERMLADMERLGDARDHTSSATPAHTPSETPVPDRLQPAKGERKRVVALVIDVDGMTELSLRVEPEVLFRRHYQLLRWLRRVVDHYDGLVQRSVDDQILLLFGVPRTRSDDLARALECAMELQRTVGHLRRHGLDLRLAIGVHAGDVTVGLGKRNTRYVARGDTTRLARRLSALADHEEILVSERILDATQSQFRFRGGPDVPNRGGRPPTPSYLVEGRRHGLRVAGKGPWLRRGREVEVIRESLQDLVDGRGSVITLWGEIGCGKSRLVREVRDLALRRGVPVYQATAHAYGEDPPLEAFRDLVHDVLGLEPDAPRSRLGEEVERLPQLGLGPRDVKALRALLGLDERTEPAGVHPGEEDTWRALDRMISGLDRDRAIIIVLEDVHHLSAAEQEGLARMARRQSEAPLLLLLTHTGPPDDVIASLGHAIELGAFDRRGVRRLLGELLEVEEVDEDIVDLAWRSCEGNPLYVEEMVKYLLQDGVIQVEGRRAVRIGTLTRPALPDSLAGLIAARIDALDPASKGALQLAATVGQSFALPVLAAAMGVEDATPLVSDLSSHGLLRRVDAEGGDAWAFASELVREAALRSILGVQRRTLHRLVAEALEALHGDDPEPHAEILASHCAQAGRHIDAARYIFMAGKRLEASQFLERARELYERGLAWIHQVPEEPATWDARVQGEAMLSYRSGALSRLLGEEKRAERALQVALDISSDAGLPWIEVRAHLELGRLFLNRGRMALAEAHIGQARSLARIEGDPELQMETLEAAANLAYEHGRNEEAETLWREALRHAGDDSGALARCHLGMASRRIREGDLPGAATLLEKALATARGCGDRILVGRVLNNMGLLHYWAGRFDDALAAFRDALRVREGIGYTAGVVINHHNIGDVHFSRGDMARAWVAFSRSRELAAEMGWQRGIVLNDVYLGYIDAVRGPFEVGLQRILEARRGAAELGDVEIAANGAMLAGRLLRDHGRDAEAIELLRNAGLETERYGLRTLRASIEDLLDEVDPERGSDEE